MSFQAEVVNRTSLLADKYVLPSADGQEAVLAIVNATFVDRGDGRLRLADQQEPIVEVDRHLGPPHTTSLVAESQLVLWKPMADVLISGHAYAPAGRRATDTVVGLRVGSLNKQILVSGDRDWRRGVAGNVAGSPRPFESIPLLFERAFGGTTESQTWRYNPVGVGYRGARSAEPSVTTEVPNFEYPAHRVRSPSDEVPAAGFGILGRSWKPRVDYAGTYDDAWLADRWPLLPLDFDPRHQQSAPHDQQHPYFKGNEDVSVMNLTPTGSWQFRLPSVYIAAEFAYDREVIPKPLNLDTLLLRPDSQTVVMTWRVAMLTRRSRGVLREVRISNLASGVAVAAVKSIAAA